MKILIASPRINPSRKKSGAEVAFRSMVQALSLYNDVVVVHPIRQEKLNYGVKSYFFRWSRFYNGLLGTFPDLNLRFIKTLRKAIKKEKPDIIHIEFPWGALVTRLLSSNPLVYRAHNVEYDYVKFYMKNRRSLRSRLFTYYVFLYEMLVCKLVDHVVCISRNDLMHICKLYGIRREKVHYIPAGKNLENKTYRRKRTNKFNVVFHGFHLNPANAEAIKIIVSRIAPRVYAKNKKIKFIIAGKGVPCFKYGNVESIGFVENLEEFLSNADLAIVPILNGSGMKIKMLDYTSLKIPLVTTKMGVGDISFVDGKHALIFDKVDDDFIEGIIRLSKDKALASKLANNAYKLFRKEYEISKISEKTNKLYNGFVKRRKRK